jgi:hypothetical protein
MITEVDERFRREAARQNFRFTCSDCANFDPELELCGNGYPTAPHRQSDLSRLEQVVFCKEFELG